MTTFPMNKYVGLIQVLIINIRLYLSDVCLCVGIRTNVKMTCGLKIMNVSLAQSLLTIVSSKVNVIERTYMVI